MYCSCMAFASPLLLLLSLLLAAISGVRGFWREGRIFALFWRQLPAVSPVHRGQYGPRRAGLFAEQVPTPRTLGELWANFGAITTVRPPPAHRVASSARLPYGASSSQGDQHGQSERSGMGTRIQDRADRQAGHIVPVQEGHAVSGLDAGLAGRGKGPRRKAGVRPGLSRGLAPRREPLGRRLV